MNFDKALELAISYLRADIPTALWGAMGIGKSALGQLLADRFQLEFIDIRLGQIEPVDLNGFAHKDMESKTFDYFPWARFPLDDTPLPDGKKGWLIMFDEGNVAPRQNLAAAYKIFLDRMVGMRKLHPRCRIMMGGNMVGQGLAGAIPAPLVSRVAHIVMTAELVPAHKQILGDSIYSFLSNHPKFILMETEEPNTPFPTLRTWEMVKKYMLANPSHAMLLEGIAGIVGNAAAVSYISFRQQEVEMQTLLQGIEAFPLERSQDLLDYLACDVIQLDRHMHRFPGEWKTLAQVRSESIKNGTTVQ
jgi:hypothetical protein